MRVLLGAPDDAARIDVPHAHGFELHPHDPHAVRLDLAPFGTGTGGISGRGARPR